MPKAKVITGGVREGQGETLEVKLNNWLETAGDVRILHLGLAPVIDRVVTAVILYDDEVYEEAEAQQTVLSQGEVEKRLKELDLK